MPPRAAASQTSRSVAAVNAALGEAARAIGSDTFHPALLEALRKLVEHDVATVVRYSASAKPVFLLHHGFSDELARLYETTFSAFDPFQAYWSACEQPGIVSLDMVSPEAAKRGRYVREFLHASRISDELGLFLPPVKRSSVALFLERSAGRFTRRERALLEDYFPLFAGLATAHQRLPAGESYTAPRREIAEADAGLAVALKGMAPDLTPRERDIVALILEGHPTATIAKRLNVAHGTVKNHRLRIYEKLDITTERELFLAYLQRLRSIAATR
jgi:DNA-binding CsgD family transcriptional regulator